MEPPFQDLVGDKSNNLLFRLTPFSRYQTLALLIILPFAGLLLGHWYVSSLSVPDQVPVVVPGESSEIENMQTSSTTRPIFSRAELIANERELMERFSIAKEDKPELYWAEDKSAPFTLVPYVADGLSMQIPYNAGWGAPYYQLTPYDRVERSEADMIVFGVLNPCPGGCMETGAYAHETVTLYPAGSLASLTAKFAEGECQEKSLNEQVSGIECAEEVMMGDYGIFVEGSQHTYKFAGCLSMDVDARKIWCPVFYESISIE